MKKKKGIVKYISFRDDINNWIARCNCTVLPSHGGEGVPNVLLESAAMGRLCIGSNISGITDVIDNGETGYLFESGDVNALAVAMERIVTMSAKSRKAMGLAGRAKVEKKFDRRIVINKYMTEIRKDNL